MATITDYSVKCVSSSKLPLCEEGGTSVIDNPVVINPPPDFMGKALTVVGDLDITGVIDPTEMVMTEQSSIPQDTADGEGAIWVRDDTPSVLMFTDDAGTDFVVGGGVAVVSLTSAGGTETLVNDGAGPDLATKGLTAGSGISLSSDAVSVTVTNDMPGPETGAITFDLTLVDGFSGAPSDISGRYVLFPDNTAIVHLDMVNDVVFYENGGDPGARGGYQFTLDFTTATVAAFTSGFTSIVGCVNAHNRNFVGPFDATMENTLGAGSAIFPGGGGGTLATVRGTMTGRRLGIAGSGTKTMQIGMSFHVVLV